MRKTISETARPNGVKIVLSSYEETDRNNLYYGTVTYIVEKSPFSRSKHTPQQTTRFFGIFNSAVSYFNQVVEKENAEGGE